MLYPCDLPKYKIPSDEVRTRYVVRNPGNEFQGRVNPDDLTGETNQQVAATLQGEGDFRHRVAEGCVDFADAEPSEVIVQETFDNLPVAVVVALLTDIQKDEDDRNQESQVVLNPENEKLEALTTLDLAKYEIKARQVELKENPKKYYVKLGLKYGVELASKFGYIAGLSFLANIKLALFLTRLGNSLTRKLGFDLLKPTISKLIGNKFPLTQDSQELLDNKTFAQIYHYFIKQDSTFKQYTAENLGKRNFELAHNTDLKFQTTALLGKLFSLGIREKFYDALRADKFKSLLTDLMQILDNVEQIEYLAKDQFIAKLEKIDKELDQIEKSNIKLRLLLKKYLETYDPAQIQILIGEVIACYVENQPEASEILKHSEIFAKTTLADWFDTYANENILQDEITDRLHFLYLYSKNPKLLKHKDILIRLARAIKRLIRIKFKCADSLDDLQLTVLIPLEADIQNIIS